jgi:SAM-dependent methyltransferase
MANLHNILRKVWQLFPESMRQGLRSFSPLVALRNWLARRRWDGASHDEIYDQEYFKFVDRTSNQSAAVIADSIIHGFHPSSVVDVGCGTGSLLDNLRVRGVQTKGLEHAQAALEFCRARQLDVMKFDVESDELPDLEKADLVISMEVGHQLHEMSADRYVEMLCRIAPLVVFSSEIPGGGDKLPRNEMPHRYWIEKFNQRGYRFEEAHSLQWRKVWKQKGTAPWFFRNVMIFRLSNR